MTHLSLFSGIGGIDLAAHEAGFETVQFVERDPFCQKVLAKNFPGVPIHDDITTFDGIPLRGRITLASGGFPCQDISQANNGAEGLAGARSGLWFQMLRVIEQVQPSFVLAENVSALMRMGLDVCLSGLESAGYATWTFSVPAAGVGAWHRRQRIFIVGAHHNRLGVHAGSGAAEPQIRDDQERNSAPGQQGRDNNIVCGDCANVAGQGCERAEQHSGRAVRTQRAPGERDELVQNFGERSRLFEPKLCRDIHGIPGGVDRLRALGNAVVPAQVLPLLQAIADFEQGVAA